MEGLQVHIGDKEVERRAQELQRAIGWPDAEWENITVEARDMLLKTARSFMKYDRAVIAEKLEEGAEGKNIGPMMPGEPAQHALAYAAGWVRGKIACKYCEGIGHIRKRDGSNMDCSPCEGSGLVFPEDRP